MSGARAAAAVSADGRLVLFESHSADIAPGDTNNSQNVFVRDLALGTTESVDVFSNGALATFGTPVALSPDGRFALFNSPSALAANDTNARYDGFLRDRSLGTTELATCAASGAAVSLGGTAYAMTPDARFVVFGSADVSLVPGDTNGVADLFVRDRQLGTVERVNVSTSGAEANHTVEGCAITPDGRFVLFQCWASNLVTGDTNVRADMFVRDRQLGTTERVDVATSGLEADAWDVERQASISADGRFVVFAHRAATLVTGDTNGLVDTFLRDRLLGTTTLLGVPPGGGPSSGGTWPKGLTPDGRFVVLVSSAPNLVAGDTNGASDVFVLDLALSTYDLVSQATGGAIGDGSSSANRFASSPDARFIVFTSLATNFDASDTNGTDDVYLRDRLASIASFCAGDGTFVDHTSACPCGNTGGSGRGCGHSFDPHGALLDATGSSTTSDDIVLHSHATPATSFTLFLQHASAGDTVFHDGVLCASGALVRLRGRAAVLGAASFPNSAFAQDSTITLSQRGGVAIGSGARRYYSAWYRNASSTFCPPATANVTNGLTIDW